MMRPLCLEELREPLQAVLIGDDATFAGVSTDTRTIAPQDLFVALNGERFDGHDYLQVAADAGAGAVLVSRESDIQLPQLRVADTQRALGLLGAYNRSLYQGPLVAITGSSGKTTVKNMLQAVLSQAGETLATQGNFNNEIGVPLTLLRLDDSVEYAVVEMGAARMGDIAWLCELGRPTVAVLLNAMPAHLQSFGSVDDVAQAKGEIFAGLGESDVAVINADQPWSRAWRKRAGAATILDFGLDNAAAISARDISLQAARGVSFTASTPAGEIAVRLALPGRHMVANALAAIAVGLACELTLTQIRDGLESVRAVAGRLRRVATPEGATLIDDCYNANPGSVRAAIDILAACEGQRTLVLGAMYELGQDSEAMHREVGQYAAEQGIDRLVGVGPELAVTVAAFGSHGEHCVDHAAAIANLRSGLEEGDTLLVKGSRSAAMEQIVQALAPESVVQESSAC